MDPHLIINLLHVLLIAPFFFWVGISRGSAPAYVFTILLVLGIIVTLYHGFKAYRRIMSGSGYAWVNLVHFLFVGPLLLAIGIHKEKTSRPYFELLLLAAFGALGYHLYEMVEHINF